MSLPPLPSGHSPSSLGTPHFLQAHTTSRRPLRKQRSSKVVQCFLHRQDDAASLHGPNSRSPRTFSRQSARVPPSPLISFPALLKLPTTWRSQQKVRSCTSFFPLRQTYFPGCHSLAAVFPFGLSPFCLFYMDKSFVVATHSATSLEGLCVAPLFLEDL